MNIFADIRDLTLATLQEMVRAGDLPEGLNTDPITTEPPRDAAHGDMATNAAMVLAKPAGLKPRDIAEKLAARLAEDDRITSAEVAGPGFLNLRLAPAVWQGIAAAVMEEESARDDFFRRMYEHQQAFREDYALWKSLAYLPRDF